MAREKYTVFISATFEDLREERDQAIKAILEMGHIPVGMEMFSAGDEQQWELIKRSIDDCDYYIVIVAHRYGSMDGAISYTEKEYDYATTKRIPSLGFVINDSAKWPRNKIDTEPEKCTALTDFKAKIKSKIVDFWSTKDELHAKISIALSKAITAYPRSGWIKAEGNVSLETVNELSRLSKENAGLRKRIEELSMLQNSSELEHENKIIKILNTNSAQIAYFFQGDSDWSESRSYKYIDLFFLLAPELMVEKSVKSISGYIGTMWNPEMKNKDKKLRSTWPVPSNTIKNIFADFQTLEIACPSKKRHSVHDSEEYWCITETGLSIYKKIRLAKLESGLARPESESSGA